MSEEVLVDVADHVATITLNAPERMNTISGPMLGAAVDASWWPPTAIPRCGPSW